MIIKCECFQSNCILNRGLWKLRNCSFFSARNLPLQSKKAVSPLFIQRLCSYCVQRKKALGENLLLTAPRSHSDKQPTLEGRCLGLFQPCPNHIVGTGSSPSSHLGDLGDNGKYGAYRSVLTVNPFGWDGLFLSVQQLQNTASPTIHFKKDRTLIHRPSQFSH